MGLFGGGNSSSTTKTTSQSSGFSQIQGDAFALQGSGNVINMTSSNALKTLQTIAGESLNQVQLAQQNASNTASSAIQAIAQSAQGQSQSLIMEGLKWGALVALAYFALKAFGKG